MIVRTDSQGSKSNVAMNAWVSHKLGRGSRAESVRLLNHEIVKQAVFQINTCY